MSSSPPNPPNESSEIPGVSGISAADQLIILHDSPSLDLTHVQAKAWSKANYSESFALFDYVEIEQNGKRWIGQVIQPNQNISVVGGRLDPTILHGLELMQTHDNVQSVQSVQIYEILILGQFDSGQMLTPRIRPLPGAIVSKLNAERTSDVIGIPRLARHNDTKKSTNVIGNLINAKDVPLCVTVEMLNYHFMVAGGTGSGKSNAAANLIYQALKFNKCVMVHDAKPDYREIGKANTDPRVLTIWGQFKAYGLVPHAAENVRRVGFYGKCHPDKVDDVVGFSASDFNPEMLASFFFPNANSAEQNAFEGFAKVAFSLSEKVKDRERTSFSLDDILDEVRNRNDDNSANPEDAIHPATVKAILRKVQARKAEMPWLDMVGLPSNQQNTVSKLSRSSLNNNNTQVKRFHLGEIISSGRIIIIDYSQMSDEAYALILSYLLRECQRLRKQRRGVGVVHLVDEAHRIFDNESRHSGNLAKGFERVMREGRSVDHSIILSLQNSSQIPSRVMNNLNSKIVMRQNSKQESDAATQSIGKDYSAQAMRLGTGQAIVSLFESRAPVLAQMAPSPFELMRNDNTTNEDFVTGEADD